MFRVTKLADYGVLMMAQFAASPHDTKCAKDIAESVGLPLPMAGKILKILAREGLLSSHRGSKGGYSLAHQPEEISVAAVIGALQGPIAVTECTDTVNGKCDRKQDCPMSANWHRINHAIREALEKISLIDMMQPMEQPMLDLHNANNMHEPVLS